ncbi:SDR family NAD(P)-dependent oxidoreductase [Photobacterium sp. TY1-4]|uniref:type I polyketide synthase n=1 Tax=Photobacterium sp. TY1-4 TaxID=2899122 RepID=UPI0021BE3686|nr:SDR family NAD(P)-dependent oxidoreductase [Photobacterium sp. TY1-4]UXI00909.1 SDR family NAD(P)-dependent oxidoreductase [Photobacterium sp. TY1-4]
MSDVKKYIFSQVANNTLSKEEAKKLLNELQSSSKKNKDVAIIGMAGRFPGGPDKEAYWTNIVRGTNLIRDLPPARKKAIQYYIENVFNKQYPDRAITDFHEDKIHFQKQGYFEQIHQFDAALFGISPREAAVIDPIQRIFLEEVYHALEDAGYGGDKVLGTNTGVFVGRNHTKSLSFDIMVEDEPLGVTGTWTGILSSRISYLFDLKGPSIVTDTACSAGLVSVHQACMAIRSGECDMALAGGVSGVQYNPVIGADTSLATYESADGIVKTFDDRANGTVWSEGAGVVMLKGLDQAIRDGDRVYAVIKGSAANNDGRSNGYTAPNALAQEEMLVKAWQDAEINPEHVSYIEAHGTGTALGDPIEIKALTNAFKRFTGKKQFCAIGTAKSNMGHLVGASGIAGLIKVVMALQAKKLPSTINFEKPNQFINFSQSPIYVSSELTPWQPDGDIPRIAGVNSFGFSGTNCHVVVQEAPAQPARSAAPESSYLFPVSAKTATSFEALLQHYRTYFAGEGASLAIQDVCYTASTGRGHYNLRAAIIATSVADLRAKIETVLQSGYQQCTEDWFLFAEHKVVSDSKRQKAPGELTEQERKEQTHQAAKLVTELAGKASVSLIKQTFLASYYVKGADVDFAQLYAAPVRRVRLPVYPYDRQEFWPEPGMIDAFRGAGKVQSILHPLLHQRAVSSKDKDIFTTELSLDAHWPLTEHLILGNNILPGTAYVEAFKAIAVYYWGEVPVEIANMAFLAPLVVTPESDGYEVQYVVTHREGELDLEVISFDGTRWVQHSAGTLRQLSSVPQDKVDLDALKAGKIAQDSMYSNNTDFSFGPRWRCSERQWVGDKEFIHSNKLASEFLSDLDTYYLHPSLLDQSANGFSQTIIPGEMYLPYLYTSMKVYKPLPAEFYTVTRLKEGKNGHHETLTFDLTLCDVEGNILAEMTDYNIKRVDRKRFQSQNSKGSAFYGVTWQVESSDAASQPATGNVVLFHRGDAQSQQLKAALAQRGATVIEVSLGAQLAKVDAQTYVVGQSESDYLALFEMLSDTPVSHVIHSALLGATPADGQLLDTGIHSVFFIIKAMLATKHGQGIALSVLTQLAQQISSEQSQVNAYGRAVEGLCKSIRQEYGKITTRVIDTDPQTATTLLCDELMNLTGPFSLAFRDGQRFTPRLKVMAQGQFETEPVALKSDGCYVITGGSGGLALETAIHLAEKKQVNLVLLSRSALDPEDPRMEKVSEALSTIEVAGSHVQYFSADVTDEASLASALDKARALYGRINGVFHCAGTAGRGLLMDKELPVFDRVLLPKVQGTVLLDRLTQQDDPDFLVFYSSITALFAGQGQGDYTAANSFMDGYAENLALQGRRALSVNWAPWKETGMAVDFGIGSGEGTYVYGVENAEALDMLDVMLASLQPVLCGGRLNLANLHEKGSIVPLSEGISRQVRKHAGLQDGPAPSASGVAGATEATDVTLTGIEQGSANESTQQLAVIWATTLGLKEIDIYDTFTSLGGDSILAIELQRALEKHFPGMFDITDIYSYPSVATMAEYLNEQSDDAAAPATAHQAALNPAQPDDAALMAMLDGLDSGDASIDDILKVVD